VTTPLSKAALRSCMSYFPAAHAQVPSASTSIGRHSASDVVAAGFALARQGGSRAQRRSSKSFQKVRLPPALSWRAGLATLENDVRLPQAVTLVKHFVVYVRHSRSGGSIVADIRRRSGDRF
jgi:hypothetical protein